MTGFAEAVVVDCLHDLILFMQHNIMHDDDTVQTSIEYTHTK